MLKNLSVTYVLGLLLPMSLIYTPRRHTTAFTPSAGRHAPGGQGWTVCRMAWRGCHAEQLGMPGLHDKVYPGEVCCVVRSWPPVHELGA